MVSGHVDAVATGSGDQCTVDAAVSATGAAVPAMAAELGVTIPDATPVSLLVGATPLRHDLTAVLNTPRVALRPGPGGTLSVDADWASKHIDLERGRRLHRAGRRGPYAAGRSNRGAVRPPSTRARLVGDRSQADSGDGDPVLGRVDAIPGLSVAFTHSGATLGLIAGELIASEIIDDEPHPLLTEFTVRRFG